MAARVCVCVHNARVRLRINGAAFPAAPICVFTAPLCPSDPVRVRSLAIENHICEIHLVPAATAATAAAADPADHAALLALRRLRSALCPPAGSPLLRAVLRRSQILPSQEGSVGAFSADDSEAAYIVAGARFGGGGSDPASDRADFVAYCTARAATAGQPSSNTTATMTPASLTTAAADDENDSGGRRCDGAAACDACLCAEDDDSEPAWSSDTTAASGGTGDSGEEQERAAEPDCFAQLEPRVRSQVMEAVREVRLTPPRELRSKGGK
jgi:hypothetical protein